MVEVEELRDCVGGGMMDRESSSDSSSLGKSCIDIEAILSLTPSPGVSSSSSSLHGGCGEGEGEGVALGISSSDRCVRFKSRSDLSSSSSGIGRSRYAASAGDFARSALRAKVEGG